MIHFDLPKEKSSIIKVIGVGGGGSNAVNHMFSQSIEGVNFIICNTDAQAIAQSDVPNKIQLGPHLTQGLGAGANPEIGKQATEESLEEIKRILEVNTKMAFITAGMGGGTGTGGAPIISKICKDLGILTVGIVTTPFSYEGKKRQLQAEEGILSMKNYVDTLLVISNDKLRHQFGNLKMKEAFAKADNVLATAAKCITDVINSTGQINVDFADVCTVMRNGGVAILGNAAAEGENRAQKAIEEALNSPLLNDNDISGAKWILININSSENEHEFTMDEVEIIQNYLLSRAGESTDVILGLGYDNNLGSKIGITLIATGFEYKDPFNKAAAKKIETIAEPEKIVMTLEVKKEEPVAVIPVAKQFALPLDERAEEKEETIEPVVALAIKTATPAPQQIIEETLMPTLKEEDVAPVILFTDAEPISKTTVNKAAELVENKNEPEFFELVLSQPTNAVEEKINSVPVQAVKEEQNNQMHSPASAASGGYLAKPSNIYAEPRSAETNPCPEHSVTPVNHPILKETVPPLVQKEEEPSFGEMQIVLKDDISSTADAPWASQTQPTINASFAEEPAMLDEAEEQKRRAAERIQKLRNLSFNVNTADPNNEFETVPAYIRRNLELYNTVSPAENFYSNYEVKSDDEKGGASISTINTFLQGKKPD
ncbi:MAG: cell division protein FtsZ [Sphingobacteriales bacterium]|nr:MAG: cell division protein FtsZ [Sphingobacteriales bacterium]